MPQIDTMSSLPAIPAANVATEPSPTNKKSLKTAVVAAISAEFNLLGAKGKREFDDDWLISTCC